MGSLLTQTEEYMLCLAQHDAQGTTYQNGGLGRPHEDTWS